MKCTYSVDAICREHGITRQGYHQARQREKADREREEEALKHVNRERCEQPRIGTRKLHFKYTKILRGLRIGRDKLFALLRRCGLLVPQRRRSMGMTHWWHSLRVYENLIRDFVPKNPNELWVSDMTYVPVGDGFAYASIVTDAFSRKIVGYDLSRTMEAEGPLRALRMALKQNRSTKGLIHHSDRGIQYCCQAYVRTLKEHGCRISMTGGGNPYENALAERVNGTLKNEYLLSYGFNSFDQAKTALTQAVRLYNERRPHLALAYDTPAEVHKKGYVRAA